MPWGKGSISREMATDLRCRDRQTGLHSDANHTQIFYNLGMDRVHYVPQKHALYFANSEHFRILNTIRKVYHGLGRHPRLEQLYLDEHGYYKGSLLLTMDHTEASAVLAALRLSGVTISIASD